VQENFKINVYFDDQGDDIHNILTNYIISILNYNDEMRMKNA